MTNVYPRETVEFVALTVLDGKLPITTYDVQITPADSVSRPISNGWTANDTLNGQQGVIISNLSPNRYHVWVRVVGNPETPVVDCGYIDVI